MPARILILETPTFKPKAEFCPGAVRADSKAFGPLAQQHHAAATNDSLFVIAPSELRYLNEFDSASKGPNSLTAVFFSKVEEAERMLAVVTSLAADDRASGVKT